MKPSAVPRLLTLSAPTPAALEDATEHLVGQLDGLSNNEFARLASTLQTARPAMAHRRVVVAASPAEAAQRLRQRDPRRVFTGQHDPDRPVVFLFSGVGDQYPGMAAGMYRRFPQFRRELNHCFRLLEPELGLDMHGVLYPEGADAGQGRLDLAALFDQRGSSQEIHRTLVAQPLMFAMQYAMANVLLALGIRPSAMLGYSIGEYVAACIAGVLPLDSALRLVALRARLVAGLPEGAMLAVVSEAGPLASYLGDSLSVAALDGPELTVLAGPVDAVTQAGKRLTRDGIACRRLAASHAFHSAMMVPVADSLHHVLAGMRLRPPSIPFLSNVTGTWIREQEATSPGYWARHLQQTIRFEDDLTEVWRLGRPILVELGPGQALTNLALRHPARPAKGSLILKTLPGPFESRRELEILFTTAGRLWITGVEIEWP